MTPHDPLARMIQAQKECKAIVERRREPSITFWTLCWWTAVGCAAGTLVSLGLLAWVKQP